MRRTLLLTSLLTLVSCEAYPRIATLIKLPAGMKAPPGALRLEMDARCGEKPPRGFEVQGAEQLAVTAEGFEITMGTRIGGHANVCLRALVDLNGNGKPDKGEAAGELAPAPFEAVDRGVLGCGDNLNRTPPIQLKRIE
jgi:hypothetical protein